ncbi:MAG: tRNA lysidine(34) synthetase TilS [Planctomycetota bacterium]
MTYRLLTPTVDDAWRLRWAHLARATGIAADDRLTLGLSGGADSVLLLHFLLAAGHRGGLHAVHVDHGLRGPESTRDAEFVADLCARHGVRCTVRRAPLDPAAPDLERRARVARYRALLDEARRQEHRTLLTAHHADDQVETLLLRWMRGGTGGGLLGARPRSRVLGEWPGQPPEARPEGLAPVTVVRPLLTLRRGEIRQLLEARGLEWIEDSSNDDCRFARNRVRHQLLPALERSAGAEGPEALKRFASAVERLERDFAARTAHVVWRPVPFAGATRGPRALQLGGSLPRSELMVLDRPLLRRALWRLLTEATGRAPSRDQLEQIVGELLAGRCGRHSLKDGWMLLMRSAEVVVLPPRGELQRTPRPSAQANLPFEADSTRVEPPTGGWQRSLELHGATTLPDGRRIAATTFDCEPGAPVPRQAKTVELDLDRLPPAAALWVRAPRPGDRFRPLGAPGRRPLRRFLADAGVPREERGSVALVGAGDQILWVVGLRPAESARVGSSTRRRLRLTVTAASDAPLR